MDSETLKHILIEIEEDLRKLFGYRLKKLFLYGSYARGDYDQESDIDIMALIDESEEELITFEKKIDEICSAYDLKYLIVLSIIIKSDEDFRKYENVIPLYTNIVKEGKEIYGI